ncbi:HDOD domain-containing protein [Domibacillus sp. DTU_2020_1001157_1_SI_ALB_TIR_016]|uniref:EAL and HDOD domain-containing protein n=1 Tax=Domibacillus sp. DTU_2020_1001157_1_SI_ALB_TIR_016 TaxID=3077789 RepID=UPI0028EA77E3|nr:HDOD domain-containing protein [Domibacillus sp. DTU_2020_1001157_1_SI_ALB_TIR_016]WNS81868.1 HDOD domain-containing protein [Domibacillus sp. DTU_2020_1001157_1_SI_ALB_TIR_016]
MNLFMARQPIFNVNEHVFGYELLYRNSETNTFPDVSPDQATIEVLIHSFLTVGVEKIAHGHPCFINFTETLLKEKVAENFPAEHVIIEVLEDIPITAELIAVLQRLKQKGYSIALDDFILRGQTDLYNELFNLTTYIKVDFLHTIPAERLAIEQKVKNDFPHIVLLAEKVETHEEFERAKRAGYELFQGYFFAKPQLIQSAYLPINAVTYFHLIKLLQEEEIDIENITRLIERDVSLSYHLLKLANSPALRTRAKIKSIKQAIMMLGFIELTKWLYMLALREIQKDLPAKTKELMESALFRAKACEELARNTQAGNAAEFFLAGMFSLVDVLLKCSMSDVLAQIPLSDQVNETLRGTITPITPFLELVVGMDMVDWKIIETKVQELGLNVQTVKMIYEEARQWAGEMSQVSEAMN